MSSQVGRVVKAPDLSSGLREGVVSSILTSGIYIIGKYDE